MDKIDKIFLRLIGIVADKLSEYVMLAVVCLMTVVGFVIALMK